MQDIAPLFQMILVIAAVASPAILFARLVSGGEEGSLVHLFSSPDPNPWPRGVQEEDPKPWNLGFTVPAAVTASTPVSDGAPNPQAALVGAA